MTVNLNTNIDLQAITASSNSLLFLHFGDMSSTFREDDSSDEESFDSEDDYGHSYHYPRKWRFIGACGQCPVSYEYEDMTRVTKISWILAKIPTTRIVGINISNSAWDFFKDYLGELDSLRKIVITNVCGDTYVTAVIQLIIKNSQTLQYLYLKKVSFSGDSKISCTFPNL